MQLIGRQPNRAPGARVHYERHRPEQTTLYRLVQQHAATFFVEAEVAAGADLPQFVKDEFDAFLEASIRCARPWRYRSTSSALSNTDCGMSMPSA